MGLCNQICLLMWKNWLLQKRKIMATILQLFLPISFALIFVALRNGIKVEDHDHPTFYQYKSIVPNFEVFRANTIIGYAPKTAGTEKLMSLTLQLLTRTMNNHDNVTAQGFESTKDVIQFYEVNRRDMQIVIIFDNVGSKDTTLPKNIIATVRPDAELGLYDTGKSFSSRHIGGPRISMDLYMYSGVIYMQGLIGEAFTQYWILQNNSKADLNAINFGMYENRMAFPPHSNDFMVDVVKKRLPLIIVLSFILTVIINTKNLVFDKEKKLKESMSLMGVMPLAQWISWFLTFCVCIIPAIGIYSYLLTNPIAERSVLLKTSGSVFLCFLLCYGFALITFCCMVSTFAQKANTAAVLAGIAYIVFYLPFVSVKPDTMLKIAVFSLFFNFAMSLGITHIGLYEGIGEGAQWSNIYQPPSLDDNWSILECMIMMVIDSFIHIFVSWYMDNIWPGEFGVPKPYNFFLTREYWHVKPPAKYRDVESVMPDTKYFEKDPTDLKAGIRICNLKKTFGNKPAIAGLTLNMYEGQITVLLGHNGAGKTTTMSVITGFIPPTSGTAFVNDCDIRNNISGARKSLGLCPQHDILFDTLTVSEHLIFFAKLKGVSGQKLKEEVDEMMKIVELDSKKDTLSMNLSGGQKRKLSVGIALIGGSKIVILDEPSSGMDPTARRQMWNVLQDAREGRTILLTTHYMDEADVLGDRIAIMAEGVVKCCGSSMFLKKLYGTGYHLVVVKLRDCNVDNLTAFVKKYIPAAEVETIVNTEVTYLLPDNQSSKFPDLFRNLENDKEKLKITSFGTSATTMEEVFLKVGESGHDDVEGKFERKDDIGVNDLELTGDTRYDDYEGNTETFDESAIQTESSMDAIVLKNVEKERPQKVSTGPELGRNISDNKAIVITKDIARKTGLPLEMSRMYGILIKRAICTWRNWPVTVPQLLLPIIFAILILSAEANRSERQAEPRLVFDLSYFGKTYIPYTDGQNPSAADTALTTAYVNQFGSSHTMEYFKVQNDFMFDNYTLNKVVSLSISNFNTKVIIGLEVIRANPPETIAAVAHYNGQPLHSEPISVNYMVNSLLQYTLDTSYSLQTAVYPLPEDATVLLIQGLSKSGSDFGLVVSFGMSFMTTLFIYFLIKEREVGSKHLQTISGVGPVPYWLPTFLWDYVTYLIASLPLLALLVAYEKTEYLDNDMWKSILWILILYGWAVLGFMYVLQFAFKSPASGVVSGIMFSILSGNITATIVAILRIPELKVDMYADNAETLFMLLFPTYNFMTSFTNINSNTENLKYCMPFQDKCQIEAFFHACCKGQCGGECIKFVSNYHDWDNPGIGAVLFFMALQGALFLLLVMVIEYRILKKIWYLLPGDQMYGKEVIGASNEEEDADVAEERKRISSSRISLITSTDSLVIVNLYKRYRSFVAVDHISVGIPEQECFGLLGVNGAGKTTTFKMLTGDIMITGGNAYMKGFDVKNNTKHVQSNMGYCPQFDALLPQMTCRETMVMYARFRGIPGANIDKIVTTLSESLMLEPHIDKLSGNCSGGNKRKLSTALALIGNPPFIMLDEPSAGMDPEARRNLWTVLSQVRALGATLVLTSHSMEECDALCTRLAIMVNGRFRCLGSPQHLKNRFGQGYTLIVQLGTLEDGTTAPNQPVIEYIISRFPGAKVFDDHQGYVHFQVPDSTIKLADVFSIMESCKKDLNVQDYSVHQTTLEQVFLRFTREQSAAREVQNLLMDYVCPCCKKKQ